MTNEECPMIYGKWVDYHHHERDILISLLDATVS
jgi:hypothetical protein